MSGRFHCRRSIIHGVGSKKVEQKKCGLVLHPRDSRSYLLDYLSILNRQVLT